jgi:hypothetical protein
MKSLSLVFAAAGLVVGAIGASLMSTGYTLAGSAAHPCDGCFAVVRADGFLAREFGALGAQRVSKGRYQIAFEAPARDCAYNATLGSVGTHSPAPGEITVRRLPNDIRENSVEVGTYSSDGVVQDHAFHLSLTCNLIVAG